MVGILESTQISLHLLNVLDQSLGWEKELESSYPGYIFSNIHQTKCEKPFYSMAYDPGKSRGSTIILKTWESGFLWSKNERDTKIWS